ncbi:hypothetical protein phiCTC2B_44 (endogenous virus) [Clostridium phage phiCTC2B]|uniref:hypothetical protein n=1 Tax=Clostridium phage phiCT453B TaxID=1567013 RepID=UPI0002F46D62|nr:hypothetical protein [Clostridium tetani]YP_009217937.1 hypothetical protein phiCT453B_41 [Clostridium phage phiCT453B]YP_009276941.1 hypothetical protein phiCT19406B_44 [Clostridium phage phiCT19406B]YP_009277385.1 hypothetical protein phiCTC2B_44 [Clostridium phage phiCTC2B]AJA42593.1 hypothetical protein phiCT453B_41 [Clostridium phage phiCT453B]AJA42801.1 hypothetical protein phiCT19406B_44 [Clostridium phage phiCT19406B]AJA42997.1 hypothetical protein phiCTC2B_44 [Clostridium phage ph
MKTGIEISLTDTDKFLGLINCIKSLLTDNRVPTEVKSDLTRKVFSIMEEK